MDQELLQVAGKGKVSTLFYHCLLGCLPSSSALWCLVYFDLHLAPLIDASYLVRVCLNLSLYFFFTIFSCLLGDLLLSLAVTLVSPWLVSLNFSPFCLSLDSFTSFFWAWLCSHPLVVDPLSASEV